MKCVVPTILILGLVFGVAVTTPSAAGAADYIIICSGQSNMTGAAPLNEMPDEVRPIPANVLYYESGHMAPDPAKIEPMKRFDWTVGGWGADTRRTYGPLPRLAHMVAAAHPRDRFIFYMEAVGGSALFQWVPDYTPKSIPEKFNLPIGIYYNANVPRIATLLKAYPKAKPLAFLWLQGESDTGVMAGVYYDNLKRLVAHMRKDTGNPDLLVIVAEPCQADEAVFEAIGKFTREDKHSALVPTRDLSGGGHKTLHFYPGKPVDELGKRFAAALLGCMTDGKLTTQPPATQKVRP